MDSKQNALKYAVTGIVILAVAMVTYYKLSARFNVSENDVNYQEQGDSSAEAPAAPLRIEESPYAGVYAAQEALEGLGKRISAFSVEKRDDGSLFGTLRIDTIGNTEAAPELLQCPSVKVSDKEFFFQCVRADLGQISFSGEGPRQGATGIEVPGRLLWNKDGHPVLDKSLSLRKN